MPIVISIHRKPGVPESPSPFFANGKPAWSAVLGPLEFEKIKVTIEKPGKKFLNDIESIYVDGKKVFPK